MEGVAGVFIFLSLSGLISGLTKGESTLLQMAQHISAEEQAILGLQSTDKSIVDGYTASVLLSKFLVR